MRPALNRVISNDFMNCLIRMSFMLLGTPQNRNRAVTRTKGRVFPAANNLGRSFDGESCFIVDIRETPIYRLLLSSSDSHDQGFVVSATSARVFPGSAIPPDP